ncbi:hypothetical protein SISNIDRAFT_460602 [Sistotremastrum niveocremeum HHB9708]|uniref:Uncharacterized protein n=2 Tax=Sistotremastraceae TaxID=3402574 RepID=A0A164NG63_9AGAM|nr:hypothetical protein SISNIDRAFT_460602 [Sistotremastrum niveocremeum HHB9708]KZT33120.1 hypothetical protein SISSUDRAFT_1054614 [Sistotremastrum suecicum HHB10207 ss-3]
MRGFRLESLGIVVSPASTRPRPWRHIKALKRLADLLDETPENWGILDDFFERCQYVPAKTKAVDAGAVDSDWDGWQEELNKDPSFNHPLLHLPHLLRILGPSSLTLYKHVLGGRRVLIYTHPAVEPACMLAQGLADLSDVSGLYPRTLARSPKVLGMITLHDIDGLKSYSSSGWIACTTDKIFLEKPWLYDIVIDLTTGLEQIQMLNRGTRPALYLSRQASGSKKGSNGGWSLVSVRFTWSDIRLWNEVEKVLREDELEQGGARNMKWADPWRIYEDACVLCASLMSGNWRAVSACASGEGPTNQRDGFDVEGEELSEEMTDDPTAKISEPRMLSRTPTIRGGSALASGTRTHTAVIVALLEIFHRHTAFLLSVLDEVLSGSSGLQPRTTIILSPKRMAAFGLGSLSELDALFIEWLAARDGRRQLVVRRGWKDLVSVVFGLG